MPRIDPVLRLKPRMPRMNHNAVRGTLDALRMDVNQLDLTPPPASLILARTRHANRARQVAQDWRSTRDRLQQEARELHTQLQTMLAQSFRPYADLTAH